MITPLRPSNTSTIAQKEFLYRETIQQGSQEGKFVESLPLVYISPNEQKIPALFLRNNLFSSNPGGIDFTKRNRSATILSITALIRSLAKAHVQNK